MSNRTHTHPRNYRINRTFVLLRNLAIVASAIVLFLTLVGRPHLRITYTYVGSGDRKTITAATYWSIGSERRLSGGHLPFVLIIPPETTLSEHVENLGTYLRKKINQYSS